MERILKILELVNLDWRCGVLEGIVYVVFCILRENHDTIIVDLDLTRVDLAH